MLISVRPCPDDHNGGCWKGVVLHMKTTIETKELLYFLSIEAIFKTQETMQWMCLIYKVFISFCRAAQCGHIEFQSRVKNAFKFSRCIPSGYISNLLCNSENAMFPNALQMLIVWDFLWEKSHIYLPPHCFSRVHQSP